MDVIVMADPDELLRTRTTMPTLRDHDPVRHYHIYEEQMAARRSYSSLHDIQPLEAVDAPVAGDEHASRQIGRQTIYEEDPLWHDVAYRRAHADWIATLPDIE